MNLSTNEVSLILIVTGCLVILINYGVVWKIFVTFSLRFTYISLTLALIPSFCFLPYLSRINNKIWFIGIFITCNTVIMSLFNIAVAAIQVYLQNSVEESFISLTMAANQMVDSAAISVIIPMCTDLYAWSTALGEEQLVYPFNYCLSFVCLAFLVCLSLIPFNYIDSKIEERS